VTHAQTWASYSALYRFGRLSEPYYVNGKIIIQCVYSMVSLNSRKYIFRRETCNTRIPSTEVLNILMYGSPFQLFNEEVW